MHVAHFIETEVPGGAERMLLTLAEDSLKRGHKVTLYHFGLEFFSDQCRLLGIQEKVLDNHLFKKTYLLPLFSIQLALQLKMDHVNVLHTHLFGPVTGSAFGAFLARVRHVGTLHDTYMVEEKPSRSSLLKLASKFQTHLVCVSDAMKSYYRDVCSLPSNAITTIYNAVQMASSPEKEPSAGELTLLVAGRLIPLKRVGDVIQAMAQLVKSNPAVRLIVAGDGPSMEDLKELSSELALGDHISFLGFQEDMIPLYQKADVFVQCSETEGLSMSILEAAMQGIPSVVSNVGSNREIVIDGETGYLYPKGDINALTNALNRLLKDPNERERFSCKAQEHAKATFSFNSMLTDYNNLYLNLSNSS